MEKRRVKKFLFWGLPVMTILLFGIQIYANISQSDALWMYEKELEYFSYILSAVCHAGIYYLLLNRISGGRQRIAAAVLISFLFTAEIFFYNTLIHYLWYNHIPALSERYGGFSYLEVVRKDFVWAAKHMTVRYAGAFLGMLAVMLLEIYVRTGKGIALAEKIKSGCRYYFQRIDVYPEEVKSGYAVCFSAPLDDERKRCLDHIFRIFSGNSRIGYLDYEEISFACCSDPDTRSLREEKYVINVEETFRWNDVVVVSGVNTAACEPEYVQQMAAEMILGAVRAGTSVIMLADFPPDRQAELFRILKEEEQLEWI